MNTSNINTLYRQGWAMLAAGLLLALGLAGCTAAQADGALTASGFIEGEQVNLAPEVAGRIAQMLVDRGDSVQTGQVLARLDDSLLVAQRAQALAGLAAAQANLANVQAGARPQEIAAAQAALTQAQAGLEGAAQAVLNATDAISNPLAIEAEISAARSRIRLAEQKLELERANQAAAELKYNTFSDQGGDVERSWQLQFQAAQAAYKQAQAELNGARRYLGVLLDMRNNPYSLQTQLHQAQSQEHLAETGQDIAQAGLERLKAGPTTEQVAVAQAQVRQAQAAVHLVEVQMTQLTLTSPLDGLVTARNAQAGETASAGAPLLSLANLDEVTLVIYIPENRIGQVRLGQTVDVQVDAFPGRTFEGQVTTIADQAEFTPRNVQTKEERVNLVFAVKVRLPNPDQALKPGMPADATLRP